MAASTRGLRAIHPSPVGDRVAASRRVAVVRSAMAAGRLARAVRVTRSGCKRQRGP